MAQTLCSKSVHNSISSVCIPLAKPTWEDAHTYILYIMYVWLYGTRKVCYGPLTRYAKLWVTHAPGMPGTFSPPLRVSDPDMHHGTCFTHVPWCISRSLTNGSLWSRCRGKRLRHSRRMRNLLILRICKRPMVGIRWDVQYIQLWYFIDVLMQ